MKESDCRAFADELLAWIFEVVCPRDRFTEKGVEHVRKYLEYQLCFMASNRSPGDDWWTKAGGGRDYWRCRVEEFFRDYLPCDGMVPHGPRAIQGAINDYADHVKRAALRLKRAQVRLSLIDCDQVPTEGDGATDKARVDDRSVGPTAQTWTMLRDCAHLAGALSSGE